jgi:CHAD domain-containing protein
MSQFIPLPLKEANLLRLRLRRLLKVHQDFLHETDPEAIHDLRVASRRLREALGYVQTGMPEKWHTRLNDAAKRITRILGPLREEEINLKIVRAWLKQNRIDPLAAELLIHSEEQKFRKNRLEAVSKLSGKTVPQCGTVSQKLRGSRTLPLTESTAVAERSTDFLGFAWQNTMTDEQLHDLRIRAKKLRYALEIDARLHSKKLGHLILRIKRLQHKLGDLHDLYVLGNLIRQKQEKWQMDELSLIPTSLESAYAIVLSEKAKIYPLLYPLYSRIVITLPPELRSFPGAETVQAAG